MSSTVPIPHNPKHKERPRKRSITGQTKRTGDIREGRDFYSFRQQAGLRRWDW